MSSTAPQSNVSRAQLERTSEVPHAAEQLVRRYCDQPFATTAAPTANSSTRSQPMIHATNSPNVA